MKKNILSLFVAAVMIMGIVTACGGAGKTPGDTAKKFGQYFADGKIDKAVEMLDGYDEATDEEKEQIIALFEDSKDTMLEEKEGVKSIKILEEEIDEEENEAKVKLKTVYGNGEEDESTTKLVKVDDEWKVTLSK
ncbi:MAG: DUF4878 domain-containing protein [Bacteroidales bacterium]